MRADERARVELTVPGARIVLDPFGGRIASLEIDGHELLVGPGEGPPMAPHLAPITWGAYPMLPWAGRLRDGILSFDGDRHVLPVTMPPHAIHGTTWDRLWDVVEASASDATLSIELGAPWPFGGRALHRVELEAHGLRATLEIHAGDRPMPAIVGWHPWFRRTVGAGDPIELDFRPAAMLRRGDDGLPSGEAVPPPPGPWDDAFVGVPQPVLVRWPGFLELSIEAPEATTWVVFDERPEGLCVEPQTGPPNGLATGEHALVAPGRPLVATMTIRWRRLG